MERNNEDPVSKFMDSPLVQWFQFVLGRESLDYEDLTDGAALNEIMLNIDPRPTNARAHKNARTDVNLNIQNIQILLKHIKSCYEDVHKQVVVMSPPRILVIVKTPKTLEGVREMQKLLLLVLGCAVQCDHREDFIEKMKQLTYEGMEVIMKHIQNITMNTDNVLNMEWEDWAEISDDDLEDLKAKVNAHIHSLVDERDRGCMTIADVTLERDYLESQLSGGNSLRRVSLPDSRHLNVEIDDLKVKLRRTKQELDEKVEQNADLKVELEDCEGQLSQLKKENSELTTDSRSARALRDENDILKSSASKAVKLELDLEMLREKVKDVDFYKGRLEEMRADYKVLNDTKALLEEEVEKSRQRLEGLVDGEQKMLELKRQLNSVKSEQDEDKLKIKELLERNASLEFEKSQSMNESGNLAFQLERARGTSANGHLSLQEESEGSSESRALRLEKENKKLKSQLNSQHDSAKRNEINQENMLELEKENQRLSNKLQNLQSHIQKEKKSVLDFEQLSTDLSLDRERLEKQLETTKVTSERRLAEVEGENEHLAHTVASLRERIKIGGDAKIKATEKENKVLSELAKELSSKLQQAEFERKKLNERVEEMKDGLEQRELIQKENAKLEKQNIVLQKSVKHYEMTTSDLNDLEQKTSDLEVENRQLKKQIGNLKNLTKEFENLEQEKNNFEIETSKLQRQVETLKKRSLKMEQLEHDKAEAEKSNAKLKQSLGAMKNSVKQTEKMEVMQIELENEVERMTSQLEVSRKRQQIRENENIELEKENDQLNTKLTHLSSVAKRVERLEAENQDCTTELVRSQNNNKRFQAEAKRLKDQVETTSKQLDQTSDNLLAMTRQNKLMSAKCEDLEKSNERLGRIEKEFSQMQSQQNIDKKALSSLREELVNSKLDVQQKQSQLDVLHSELIGLGVHKEALSLGDSDKRFSDLESKLESTLQISVSAKEDKINSLESRLNASTQLNNSLKVELKELKKDYEALSQRHFEATGARSPKKESSTAEVFKMKDQLISVERKNATLLAENEAIKASSSDLQSRINSLQSQLNRQGQQNDNFQDLNQSLQKQFVKLQVENSALQAKCDSLSTLHTRSSHNQSAGEKEKKALSDQLEKEKRERESLERDNDDLATLNERKTIELEGIFNDHQKLKQVHRQTKQELKDLEDQYKDLVRRKNDLQKDLEASSHSDSVEVLKEAHDKINRSYKKLSNDYEDLQSEYSGLKTAHNQIKLEYAKLEAVSSDMRDHNQQLDITATKLNNRCEVLMQLKENLEEENRHLLEQISRLMSQNEELLSQTLESKDQIYSEQKQYTERMQEIRRQKEKLEEKIMDLYRAPGNSPHRKKGFGSTLKKTFQNLGKSEGKRRKEPASFVGSPGEGVTLKNDPKPSPGTPQRSGSIDSGSTEGETPKRTPVSKSHRNMGLFNHLRRLYPANQKGRYSFDHRESRRSKLGSMAYSTNALNYSATDSRPNLRGSRILNSGSTTSLQRSTEDVSIVRNRTTSSLADGESPKGDSPGKERISLQQFLHENDKKPGFKPTPAKRSKSPEKTTWGGFTPSTELTHSPRWGEDPVGKPPLSPNRPLPDIEVTGAPTPRVPTPKSPPPKSPRSTLALIKVREGREEVSAEERESAKKETFVYVVRSKSDIGAKSPGNQPTVTKPTNSVQPFQNSESHDRTVQRLDSLIGSPRSTNDLSPREVKLRSRPQNRRPVSAAFPGSFNRDRTSTPVSRISPIMTSPSGSQSVIRRDVPPPGVSPAAPSPIRRDVPPDMTSSLPRRPRDRPPTPKNDESEKNTLWYEYGCV